MLTCCVLVLIVGLQDDTKLVSILYRTHKTLPPVAKISSLYVFDALSRAARSHANKHPQANDPRSVEGNSATFLLKVEGILEGLFSDMVALEQPEAKVSVYPTMMCGLVLPTTQNPRVLSTICRH